MMDPSTKSTDSDGKKDCDLQICPIIETEQIDVRFKAAGKDDKVMEEDHIPLNSAVSCCLTLEQASVTAVAELRSLWSQIGLSSKEQDEQVTEIHRAARQCFFSAVEHTQSKLVSLTEDIKAHSDQIISLRDQLGMPEELAIDSSSSESLQMRASELQNCVDALSKTKQSWVQKIRAQQEKLESHCLILGRELPAQFSQIGALNDNRIAEFVSEIRAAAAEVTNRKESVAKLVVEICSFWEELEITPSTELEQCIACYQSSSPKPGLGLSMDVIEALSASAAELADKKAERLEEVRSLGAEIMKLWTQLNITAPEQDKFKNGQRGIGLGTVKACERELLRLREIKVARLPGLIVDQKQAVQLLHEKAHAGPAELHKYELLCGAGTDGIELFEALETYIAGLRKKCAHLRPVLTSVQKWRDLVKERAKYEELLMDSSRLLSRRSGKALAEELKMEKRVRKTLPALAKKLKARITEWEQTEDELWVDGQRFLDHMDAVEQTHAEKCAAKKATKRASKQKKLDNDLRYGSQPARTPYSARKSMAGRPARSSTPLMMSNKKGRGRSRWTVAGAANVCRLNKEN